ncbi:MAG: hypothetical protein QXQ40_02400 [Candidatus Aenigmatarchaeota archaeon]
MELKVMISVILMLVIVVLGFSILSTISGISITFPKSVRLVVEGIYSVIFGSPYNICEAYENRVISFQEFKTLLVAIHEGACKDVHARVKLGFSLSKDEFKKLPKTIGISKEELVFFREAKPLGADAIIVKGNPGYYPVKLGDLIEIWQEGYPQPDILITVALKGCDPFDDVCDLMCSFTKGICDPLCYENGKKEDVMCDIDCVDVNKNNIIDEGDLDGICDLDCYNNIKNPDKAYDPDCSLMKITNPAKSSEYGIAGVCEPDIYGVKDGICDPDCAQRNGICDPDCDGNVSDNNPMGLKDDDCYTCDGICNGYCSPTCTIGDRDPDCPFGFVDWNVLEECCGNRICGKNENCELCSVDCPSGNTCEDFGKVCCPKDKSADNFGCTIVKNLTEGGECTCNIQCAENLTCEKISGHCCPEGKFWNGTNCTIIPVCPTDITSCYNRWHWNNFGTPIKINIQGYSCDYFEVCYDPIVKNIAKEIIDCCNNRCSGNCHSLCNKALSESGLGSIDTQETRKKCYGLYTLYGLGPAARWMKGYMIHIEEPASIMLSKSTWMCTGYSIVLTTLLRSVGYKKDEAYTICGPQHAYNIIKFPGDTKFHLADTVGNRGPPYRPGSTPGTWYPYCSYGGCSPCMMNDEGGTNCPPRSNVFGC